MRKTHGRVFLVIQDSLLHLWKLPFLFNLFHSNHSEVLKGDRSGAKLASPLDLPTHYRFLVYQLQQKILTGDGNR